MRFYPSDAIHKRGICSRKMCKMAERIVEILCVLLFQLPTFSETNRRYKIPTGSPIMEPYTQVGYRSSRFTELFVASITWTTSVDVSSSHLRSTAQRRRTFCAICGSLMDSHIQSWRPAVRPFYTRQLEQFRNISFCFSVRYSVVADGRR